MHMQEEDSEANLACHRQRISHCSSTRIGMRAFLQMTMTVPDDMMVMMVMMLMMNVMLLLLKIMMMVVMMIVMTNQYNTADPIQKGRILLPQQYAHGLDTLSRQSALKAQIANGGWQLTYHVTQERILLNYRGRGEAQAANLWKSQQGGQQGRVKVAHIFAIAEHE